MSKLVRLELEGNLEQHGFRVTLEISKEENRHPIRVKGSLPANPELAANLEHHWQKKYRSLGNPVRITSKKIIHIGLINQHIAECKISAEKLKKSFLTWLKADSFSNLDLRLREEFNREDCVRLLISTENYQLHKLPWQEWDFLDRYKNSEVAFSATECEPPFLTQTAITKDKIQILAILGHSQGIDVEVDRQKLKALPNAEVKILIEPSRQELNEQLWEQPWDLLFFAGHSETEGEKGRIYLNPHESLSLGELKHGLEKAISQGLKIAIFNSCDGLGLVQELKQLSIPQMIVMREPVPDKVAQIFLQHFLQAFARGVPLYQAEREAREKLQGLEGEFPCASWLPVIYQNSVEVPPNWEELGGVSRGENQDSQGESPGDIQTQEIELPVTSSPVTVFSKLNFRTTVWVSVVVTAFVMGIRLLGFLQSQELKAYDHLMRSRQSELPDSRILVVEVTEEDTTEYGYPLEDSVLTELLQKLLLSQPTAIGLDMHRYQPRGEGRTELINLFNQNQNLFTVCTYGQSDPTYSQPPEFSEQQLINQVGFSNLPQDLARNGTRRQLLTYDPKLSNFSPSACFTPYSFSFQLAYQHFLHQKVPIQVTENQEWQFGNVIFPKLPKRFGGYQDLDGRINEIVINYRSGSPGQKVTLQQFLSGNVNREHIQDRIILVGYTASVARDDFNTPYGTMAGVWVHAHGTSQILSAVENQRSLIWAFPQGVDALLVLGSSLIAGLLIISLRSTLALAVTMGIVTVVLHQICLGILNQGGWMPFIPSVLGLFLTAIILIIYRFGTIDRLIKSR